MRDTFVKTLIELAKKDKTIELVTGDLGFGVLKPFWEACPDQFTNAGIAEQNMTSLAAGMSLGGKNVFTYSIGNFPTIRCLEQIRNDCAYHNANVKIVCVGGGFSYGPLGVSHHATEDLSIMKSIPNVFVFAPGDLVEAEAVTIAAANYFGTAYIRLGRGGEQKIHSGNIDFVIGKPLKIKAGKRIVLFSTGTIISEVLKAADLLSDYGFNAAVFSFPTIKPLNNLDVRKLAKEFDYIFTVEENTIVGGFGSSIASIVAEMKNKKASILNIGIPDSFVSKVGTQEYLRKECGLDGESIVRKVIDYINE